MTQTVKTPPSSTEIIIFVFPVEAFKFSKFHENKAKHDKHIFNRGLNVIFMVKNSYIY